MISRLDHLNFSVTNLQESIDWYSEVFGFETVESGTYNGVPWAIIKSDQAMLAMYERANAKHISSEEQKKMGLHGVAHIGMVLKDEKTWRQRVADGLVKVDHTWKYPHSFSWYVNDPSGHEIEVVKWDDGIRFD